MFKKYDHRLVKSYKSYTLQELCRLYKEDQLHIQTIRGWLRNGELTSIKDGNKHLIYGAVFKKFLFERNKKHKKHMHFNEFKCCACKQINVPLEATILSAAIKKNRSILATALCPNCGCEVKRLYKGAEANQILDTFQIESEALLVLSDISSNASKTHLKVKQKSEGSESIPSYQSTDLDFSSSLTKLKE
ncbi:TPA: helix-turn-helix domain-containing protein [Legionella pneumophila]